MDYELNVGDLKKLLANVPDEYKVRIDTDEGDIAVPNGEDRIGITYNRHRYTLDLNHCTVHSVNVESEFKEVQLKVNLILEEAN